MPIRLDREIPKGARCAEPLDRRQQARELVEAHPDDITRLCLIEGLERVLREHQAPESWTQEAPPQGRVEPFPPRAVSADQTCGYQWEKPSGALSKTNSPP